MPKADTQEYRQQLLTAYSSDPENGEIEEILNRLEAESPALGGMWRQIMSDWDRLNHSGFPAKRGLRDDLPQDDSLCIVVFGYGLNKDGSMKPELVERLRIALRAAQQYPNAYVLVTGGETAGVRGISEAAVMAIWLMNNDISEDRIILEKQSLSTTENALNTCSLLNREYPHVRYLAAVTSDYHITQSAVALQTVCTYSTWVHGGREMYVVDGASCATGKATAGSLITQARSIAVLTATKWMPDAASPDGISQPETEPEYWEETEDGFDTGDWFDTISQ